MTSVNNNQNSKHLLTQIKHQVEEKCNKKYQKINQKATFKYYQLCMPKIILIQKHWRKYLVKKTKIVEENAFKQLCKYEQNIQQNQKLKEKLKSLKMQSFYDTNENDNKQNIRNQSNKRQAFSYEQYRNMLQNQLKNSIGNAIQLADKHAKIQAVTKSQIQTLNQITKNNFILKKQHQAQVQQLQTYKRRNQELGQKLSNLRKAIAFEKHDIQMFKAFKKGKPIQPHFL